MSKRKSAAKAPAKSKAKAKARKSKLPLISDAEITMRLRVWRDNVERAPGHYIALAMIESAGARAKKKPTRVMVSGLGDDLLCGVLGRLGYRVVCEARPSMGGPTRKGTISAVVYDAQGDIWVTRAMILISFSDGGLRQLFQNGLQHAVVRL
jgi:hypothetical protein